MKYNLFYRIFILSFIESYKTQSLKLSHCPLCCIIDNVK